MSEQLMIISGASSGIGAELATAASKASVTAATISRRPGPGEHLASDLSDPAQWDVAANWIDGLIDRQPWERVMFVHNSATIEPIGFAGEVDSAAYTKNVLLNSASPQVLGDRFIAAAERAGCPAQLQIISSGAGKQPYVGWSSYCAAKASVDMWVRAVGQERAQRNSAVTVVSIAPGIVDTPMQGVIRTQDVNAFPDVERFRAFKADDQLRSANEVAATLLRLSQADHGQVVGGTRIENGAVLDVSQLG